MEKPKVYTIVGPTASGKTKLSLDLALEIKKTTGKDVEIISADSRQVYKNIPVTTAQPAEAELKKFRHHFIAELELNEEFSAGEFGIKARKLTDKIFNEGKTPLIVGGSGLYINSLIYGLFEYSEKSIKEVTAQHRKKLYDILQSEGLDSLTEKLGELDAQTLDELKTKGLTERRVIRALEVYLSTGIPVSEIRKNKSEVSFTPVLIGINYSREKLYQRINDRADEIIKNGIVEEISRLHEKGFHYSDYNSLNTVGAKEVFDYIEGLISFERMRELIKQNTRRFAKRQLTWFRRDKNIKWFDAEANSFKVVARSLIEFKSER